MTATVTPTIRKRARSATDPPHDQLLITLVVSKQPGQTSRLAGLLFISLLTDGIQAASSGPQTRTEARPVSPPRYRQPRAHPRTTASTIPICQRMRSQSPGASVTDAPN